MTWSIVRKSDGAVVGGPYETFEEAADMPRPDMNGDEVWIRNDATGQPACVVGDEPACNEKPT